MPLDFVNCSTTPSMSAASSTARSNTSLPCCVAPTNDHEVDCARMKYRPGNTPSAEKRPAAVTKLGYRFWSSRPLTGSRNTAMVSLVMSGGSPSNSARSEEHTSELQSRLHLVCRLLLEKKKKKKNNKTHIQ